MLISMEICRNQKPFLDTQGQMKKINADQTKKTRELVFIVGKGYTH